MSRDAIFSKLRQARGTGPREGASANATPHIIPQRARVSGADAISIFITHLEAHGVCVERLAKPAQVPSVVQRYLKAARVPLVIRMGSDPHLATLPWSDATGLDCFTGCAAPHDLAAISVAIAGIAETGTLVLTSGPDNPTTLAFMPDMHFVTINAASIKGSMEDAFEAVRLQSKNGVWPRAVNLISAASRTGDIGGQLVMGAHGPRQLVVLIVGQAVDHRS